jgi:hypothetical protein
MQTAPILTPIQRGVQCLQTRGAQQLHTKSFTGREPNEVERFGRRPQCSPTRLCKTGPSICVCNCFAACTISAALRLSVKSSHPPPETLRSPCRRNPRRRSLLSRARHSSSGRVCGPSPPRARPMCQERDLRNSTEHSNGRMALKRRGFVSFLHEIRRGK